MWSSLALLSSLLAADLNLKDDDSVVIARIVGVAPDPDPAAFSAKVRLDIRELLHGTLQPRTLDAQWNTPGFRCGSESISERQTFVRRHTSQIESIEGKEYILVVSPFGEGWVAQADTLLEATKENRETFPLKLGAATRRLAENKRQREAAFMKAKQDWIDSRASADLGALASASDLAIVVRVLPAPEYLQYIRTIFGHFDADMFRANQFTSYRSFLETDREYVFFLERSHGMTPVYQHVQGSKAIFPDPNAREAEILQARLNVKSPCTTPSGMEMLATVNGVGIPAVLYRAPDQRSIGMQGVFIPQGMQYVSPDAAIVQQQRIDSEIKRLISHELQRQLAEKAGKLPLGADIARSVQSSPNGPGAFHRAPEAARVKWCADVITRMLPYFPQAELDAFRKKSRITIHAADASKEIRAWAAGR